MEWYWWIIGIAAVVIICFLVPKEKIILGEVMHMGSPYGIDPKT